MHKQLTEQVKSEAALRRTAFKEYDLEWRTWTAARNPLGLLEAN